MIVEKTVQRVLKELEMGQTVSVYFRNEDGNWHLGMIEHDGWITMGWEDDETGDYNEETLWRQQAERRLEELWSDCTIQDVYIQ